MTVAGTNPVPATETVADEDPAPKLAGEIPVIAERGLSTSRLIGDPLAVLTAH